MVVVVELRLLTFVITGMAIGTIAGSTFAAPEIVGRRPLDVIRDDQVQPAVLIVVKPPRTGRPSPFIRDLCLDGNIGEGSVAVVVIKDGASVPGHVQIRIAIVVEVAHGDSLPIVSFTTHAGFLSNICKGTVAIIVVKSAAQGMRRFVNVGRSRLDKEQVHEPVLIVDDPGYARAHGLKGILLLGLGGI